VGGIESKKIQVEKGISAMNKALFSIVAGALATCPMVYAQNMVEYSNLASKTTSSMAAASQTVANKAATLNAATAKGPHKGSAAGKKSAVSEPQSVPVPTPATVFVLSNGDRLELTNYLLTVNSLHMQQGQTQRTIPLSALNLDATIAANRERGLDLKIPKNKSEVTLSF
jgi:hypothetical protein